MDFSFLNYIELMDIDPVTKSRSIDRGLFRSWLCAPSVVCSSDAVFSTFEIPELFTRCTFRISFECRPTFSIVPSFLNAARRASLHPIASPSVAHSSTNSSFPEEDRRFGSPIRRRLELT
uniref:Uncharacterized protein n=1 Tax=Heterorhabditis bacteriophora TaxID=37862 RepID=A0A1I7WZY2_HETBA